jgi:DNA-directed RNA polymerase subunit F
MRLIREELITNTRAKKIISEIGKPDDMKFEQKNAFENLKKFAVADPKEIEALVEELTKINKLRDRNIIAIANTLPEDNDDLRAILHKEYSNYTTDEVASILTAVKKVKKPAKSTTKSSKPKKKSA